MIRALLARWRDRRAHEAAQYLIARRIRKERELIRSTAQQMRIDMGLPPDTRLRA
jgi:hypothetical protein